MSHTLVYLGRKGAQHDSVTGFIEYNDLRIASFDQLEQEKIDMFNSITKQITLPQLLLGNYHCLGA